MEMDQRYCGFQTLEQDFFRVCKKIGIRGDAQLLLIYLRGLASLYGRPDIYRSDAIIIDEMGISPATLKRSRKILQQRQVIDYKTSQGRGKATTYLILKTDLAPIIKERIKGIKKIPFMDQKDTFYKSNSSTKRYQKDTPIYIRDKKEQDFIPVDRKQMRKDVESFLKTVK